MAQDTGSAIKGGVRVDYYWGYGDAAGEVAGKMKHPGQVWMLLPNGYTPLPALIQAIKIQISGL